MLYAIMPFAPGPDLDTTIRTIDPHAYTNYAPNLYLVSFQGNTEELSRAIGYLNSNTRESVGGGLILKISYYHGRAYQDMWEWIEDQKNGN